MPNDPSLDLTTSLTIEAWTCMVEGDENPGVWILKRGGPGGGYVMGLNNDNVFLGGIFHQQTTSVAPPAYLNTGWHHLAWTYDGAWSKLYIDGSLVRQVAYANTVGVATSDLVIGMGLDVDGLPYPAGGAVRGWYDEIRVWNIARSAAEIQSTYDRSLVGDEAGLVGYRNFDSWDARDLSTFGNDGELLNGAYVGYAHGGDPIPEPASALLVGLVLGATWMVRRRRR